MSRASVSCFGRSGDLDLTHSNPDRVTPITSKLILVASQPGARHYCERARTGWLSVRIMCLSGILGYGIGSWVSQWGSTINSARVTHPDVGNWVLIVGILGPGNI